MAAALAPPRAAGQPTSAETASEKPVWAVASPAGLLSVASSAGSSPGGAHLPPWGVRGNPGGHARTPPPVGGGEAPPDRRDTRVRLGGRQKGPFPKDPGRSLGSSGTLAGGALKSRLGTRFFSSEPLLLDWNSAPLVILTPLERGSFPLGEGKMGIRRMGDLETRFPRESLNRFWKVTCPARRTPKTRQPFPRARFQPGLPRAVRMRDPENSRVPAWGDVPTRVFQFSGASACKHRSSDPQLAAQEEWFPRAKCWTGEVLFVALLIDVLGSVFLLLEGWGEIARVGGQTSLLNSSFAASLLTI